MAETACVAPALTAGGAARCPLRASCACCPQSEQAVAAEPDARRQLQAQIRKNVTETLVSLRVNTVDDIQQIAAALAQCTVGGSLDPSAAPVLASLPGHVPVLGSSSM